MIFLRFPTPALDHPPGGHEGTWGARVVGGHEGGNTREHGGNEYEDQSDIHKQLFFLVVYMIWASGG